MGKGTNESFPEEQRRRIVFSLFWFFFRNGRHNNNQMNKLTVAFLFFLVSCCVCIKYPCIWNDFGWETSGAESTSFCCGNYEHPVADVNVRFNITSDDEFSVYIVNDCKTILNGRCVDCCSDSNCLHLQDCDQGTCTGSYNVQGIGCAFTTYSFVFRCNAGLFDSCMYTINHLQIVLDQPSTDPCCTCTYWSFANVTSTYY